MALGIYVGRGGNVRNVKEIYLGRASNVRTVKEVYVGRGGSVKKVWPAYTDYGDLMEWISWGSIDEGYCDGYYYCAYNDQDSVGHPTLRDSANEVGETLYNNVLADGDGRICWFTTTTPIDLGLYEMIRLYNLQMWTEISGYYLHVYPIFSIGSDPGVCPLQDSGAVYSDSYYSYKGNDTMVIDLTVDISGNSGIQVYPKIGFWYRCTSSGSRYTTGWAIPSQAQYGNGGNIRMYYDASDYTEPSYREIWHLTY